ncbi:MAG: general secretion pathway protein GspK [Deltaproteobacteria bacterium]|nr:MAG: general secretion pathway protein GspK [Deltaproteobacteria bacterium]
MGDPAHRLERHAGAARRRGLVRPRRDAGRPVRAARSARGDAAAADPGPAAALIRRLRGRVQGEDRRREQPHQRSRPRRPGRHPSGHPDAAARDDERPQVRLHLRRGRREPRPRPFSDENSAYDRYVPRYKAKNAPLDSLEELYMVRGVNDRFMAAFGDRLTVWLDVNAKLNINSNDPLQMLTNILSAAANPNDPKLRDPRLLAIILQEIQVRKMFSFLGLSAQDFIGILKANGIRVNPVLENTSNPGNFLASTSDTFRITATGRAGRIEKTLTAVVRYDDLLGKLLYWKED